MAAGVTRIRFATYLAPSVLPLYRAVAEEVARRLDVQTELVVESSYDAFEADAHDVSFVCSLPYVMLEEEAAPIPVAAPALQGQRYAGRPIYYSDVIVRSDSAFGSFDDLRGASWAYNEPRSWSGFGIVLHELARRGVDATFFGRVLRSRFHRESIRMVANGEVEASAIDSQVLEIAMRDDPGLADRIRVIDSLGPSTIQPVTVSSRVSPDLRGDLAGVLIELHEASSARPALEATLVDRFVPVHAGSYDDIRQMHARWKRAGLTLEAERGDERRSVRDPAHEARRLT